MPGPNRKLRGYEGLLYMKQDADGSPLQGVTGVAGLVGGTGFTSAPAVAFAAPPTGGRQALGHAVLTAGAVSSIVIDDPGLYAIAPTGTITGGGGTGASITGTTIANVSSKLASISKFDLTIKADSIDASDHDTAGWKDKLTGLKEWSGTVEMNYKTSEVSQVALFNALVNGYDVDAEFRPSDQSGEFSYSGLCVISDFKHTAQNNGVQSISASIEGRGPLTRAAVQVGGAGV